jgi:thiamine kinase-like enzyme
MNKILSLFDEKFVLNFLSKKILPLYPAFEKILSLKIYAYKKLIWTTTYHVVISYRVNFLTKAGKEKEMEIVCSAHSSENRESVFNVLSFLRNTGFFKGDLVIPRPLFYSSEFNGTFYRAVSGHNLLYFIKNKKLDKVKSMVEKASRLFAGLHTLKLPQDLSIFNDSNMLLRNVVPGRDTIISEIAERFKGRYVNEIASFYQRFIAQEEEFFSQSNKRWLIHGDAHPENIVSVGYKKIGLIDFTDFCPGDFARDLGTFMQQLEYKLIRHLGEGDFVLNMKRFFLETYLKESNLKLDENLQKRIDLYYNWTWVRTAAFWLLKHDCEPNKAEKALQVVEINLSNGHHAQD